MWRRIAEAWEDMWLRIHARFAWFHLMRARSDRHFIIVYDLKNRADPQVDGYDIVSSSYTPWGCVRSAKTEVWFDTFMEDLGPAGRAELVQQLDQEVDSGQC